MKVPSCVTDCEMENPGIQKYIKLAAQGGFKPTKASSLKAALQLAYVYYAFKKFEEVCEIGDYFESFVTKDSPNLWAFEKVLCLKARVSRERGDVEEAERCKQLIVSLGFNPSLLGLPHIEKANSWALLDMTKRMEEEWRIEMLYKLAFVIELGGSDTLSTDRAELEFHEHLVNLRAILEIPQEHPPERTAKNTAIYPIKSLLFSNDYVPGHRHAAPTPKADITRVDPDDNGWIKCPNCGFRFNANDHHVFDGKKHKRCGQRLAISQRTT